ncbi:hypothetical protein [Streptomyces cinereoruber]|uniref:hypothetical protein n=1 Tax=Streptomyces cinereoruber TaxID=67260 RepID=UPI003642958B
MGNIDTWVTVDDRHIYRARVDLSDRWNGWLSPRLTIDAVRELARHTQEMDERYDEIRVIESESGPVVLHIRWQFLEDGPSDSVTVEAPDADGLYSIGAWEWTWYQIKDGPLFHTQNEARDAWADVLARSGRRIGEILRTQLPNADMCRIALSDGLGRIVQIYGAPDGYGTYGALWSADDDTPFDPATLAQAEEVLNRALDHGQDPILLEISGWHRALRIDRPDLHQIAFAPADCEPAGGGPLNEAHAKATETRRKLLAETTPYLIHDIRADYPNAAGVVVDPTADQPFLALLDDDGDPEEKPTKKVAERLAQMFFYRPTADDMAACGWSSAPLDLDGGHVLTFPAQ